MYKTGRRGRPRDLFHEAKWCIYAQILVQKVRIKWTLFFHGVLFGVAILRVLLLDLLPNLLEWHIRGLDKYTTDTESWEYIWLLSGAVAALSACAMNHNNRRILYFAIFGSILFGILPLCYGFWSNRLEVSLFALRKDYLKAYLSDSFQQKLMEVKRTAPHSTFTILQYYWISLAMQVHFFHTVFVQQLRQTLRTVGTIKH